jgi:phage terminase small subunit
MPRRAKALWAAVWANPANATLLKTTDHGVVARWCVLTYCIERDLKQPPDPTVEETRTTVSAEGAETTTTKIKPNPAFVAWHQNMREIRAIEGVLGFAPSARLTIDGKLGHKQQEGGAADAGRTKQPGAPAGPLGILKQPTRHN